MTREEKTLFWAQVGEWAGWPVYSYGSVQENNWGLLWQAEKGYISE
jgi:hypothetical protein